MKDDWENKKIWEIEKKFINDISFQNYVISNSFEENWINRKLENFYFAYLNKDYIKKWPLDINQLIRIDQANTSFLINIIQNKKETQKSINDFITQAKTVANEVEKIKKELLLSENEFNKIYEFPGNKYLEYFGENKPFGTIYAIPSLNHHYAKHVKSLHQEWHKNLLDLNNEQLSLFGNWKSAQFLANFIECKNENSNIIDNQAIDEILDSLNFPLYFYDYETVSVPIPFLDNTHTYQQVVVQYSLHKVYPNGEIHHYGWIFHQENNEKIVDKFDLWDTHLYQNTAVSHSSNKIISGHYSHLLEEFLLDIWDELEQWSFIVWYKPFENTRNKEISELFPHLSDQYLKINENTFDLMEIFSQNLYFDLWFEWSNSIKKVLPVLVPDLSYKDLAVGNGAVAMKELYNVIKGKYTDSDREQKLKDLLIYCGQDSLAMYKIYEVLKRR